LKIILFANTDWYLYNYRLPLAEALRDEGHELLLLSPSGKYAQRIQDDGFAWQVFDLSRRGINPLIEYQTVLRLTQVYRREKPDLVHHFTIKCVLYGSVAARKAGVKRVINAVTGLGYVFSTRSLFTWLVKPVIEFLYQRVLKGSHVIFQNQNDLNYFIDNKLASKNQCVLIPGSGVDVDKFRPATPHAGLAPLVVLPARMLWDKGVKEFVDVAELVKQSGMKARFVLVGDVDDGNPSSISREQLQEWQNKGAVEWWGWQEDMISVYQQASIICLPSYSEGLAKSLIEGAACGCPLVASDIPGCREVVENGLNGLLVPPRDAQALAEALLSVLSDKKLMRRMGAESRKIAVRKYSVQRIVAETISVYNDEVKPLREM